MTELRPLQHMTQQQLDALRTLTWTCTLGEHGNMLDAALDELSLQRRMCHPERKEAHQDFQQWLATEDGKTAAQCAGQTAMWYAYYAGCSRVPVSDGTQVTRELAVDIVEWLVQERAFNLRVLDRGPAIDFITGLLLSRLACRRQPAAAVVEPKAMTDAEVTEFEQNNFSVVSGFTRERLIQTVSLLVARQAYEGGAKLIAYLANPTIAAAQAALEQTLEPRTKPGGDPPAKGA